MREDMYMSSFCLVTAKEKKKNQKRKEKKREYKREQFYFSVRSAYVVPYVG